MKQFDVLDRTLSMRSNYLLEASAGTGKTFSIQNIVVRLLIESPSISLDKILIVTFTRAATRDLQLRIRKNIEECLSFLNQHLMNQTISDGAPDYLVALMEESEDHVLRAKRHLQQALFAFDHAAIYTIHSFCSRMLRQHAIESDMGFHAGDGQDPLPSSEISQIIRDCFRTELREGMYSPGQIGIYLRQDPQQNKLLKVLKSGHDFAPQPTFQEYHHQFIEQMSYLKNHEHLTSALMMEDFDKQVLHYNRHKDLTNEERRRWAEKFSWLFDQEEWSAEEFDQLITGGMLWSEFFDTKILKKSKSALHDLHYPTLSEILNLRLVPLVRKAGDFTSLLARLAKDCSRLFKKYQNEEERISPDDLLQKMDQAVKQPPFAEKVRGAYQAAIIDEFQDTDPLQWQIFKKLFLPSNNSWNGFLYLVGDPKQSIYSFRQADIYTYLSAAQMLGQGSCYTLNVNYRSQPQLIQALNTLFDPLHVPGFMPLPKQAGELIYQPVKASEKQIPFQDEKGAIHFFMAEVGEGVKSKLEELEREIFFPFIVQEIKRIRKQKGLSFHQFAVLVRDRHQGDRLMKFMDDFHLPYVNQRGMRLNDSLALKSMIDLLRAILRPYDKGALKIALGSPLLGFTHSEVVALSSYDEICFLLQQLHFSLFEKGFSYFYDEVLLSQWKKDGIAVQERLLGQDQGLEFYHDLQQIAELIIEHHLDGWNTPEGIIPFLDHFEEWAEDENEKLIRVQDPDQEGVKIMTLHYSKGLEFEIVFALGLVKRDSAKSGLIPLEVNGRMVQTPLSPQDPAFLDYCQEVDAEKMRQLYVALTRAKTQLYIPLIIHSQSSVLDNGEASPLDLWVGRLQHPLLDYAALYARISQGNRRIIFDFLESIGTQHDITYSLHQKIELLQEDQETSAPIHLSPPREISVEVEPLMISSFTSLSHHQSSVREQESFSPPHDLQAIDKNIHTLPASSVTGLFLHSIMENITFADWKTFSHPIEGLPLLQPLIRNSDFGAWELTIAELVFNVLKTPLKNTDHSFCLANLKPNHLYREMPFIFPCEGVRELEELMREKGMIKGVIDLIFTHNNKYYILDWKSNWLGPHQDAYGQEELCLAMREHAYFLQASIYTEALKRYLRLVDARPFEECFGGIFYLFMRGIVTDSQSGIYYWRAGE